MWWWRKLTGHGEGLCADLERENLASNNPRDRAPRTREEEDVDADKGDQETLDGEVVGANNGAGDGDDELAHGHADGAEQEQLAATPLLDEPQTGEGRDDVDAGGDHGDDKGVVDASVLEEGGTVVEDEVLELLVWAFECA